MLPCPGFRSCRYGRPPIVVTESGCDVPDESALSPEVAVHDTFRIDYYKGYLAAAMKAKNQDGVDLQVWLLNGARHKLAVEYCF